MTPEEAIQVADEVLLAHTGSSLTDIRRMILRESLDGKGYEQMEGYAPQHIKNEGKKLWDLLSEALGEKVGKTSFRGVLEKRLKSGNIMPTPPMPSTYNGQTWVGRESLVTELLPKLQGQTRLLWITGISGIGKTTLGECLVSKAWERDPTFQWIYLEILEGQSPDFPSVAADLLAKLGESDLDPQERNNPEQLAKRLLQKLQSHPYWIQLDALERLLNPEQSTELVDPYWATFLQRCLTDSPFASRLVLTSQAFPNALIEFGDLYPNVWTEIRLDGLLQVEQQHEFFAKRGISVEPANQDILTQIAKIYEGHPLVLKVIAEDILKDFAGDVVRYWQIYQPEFEQVARELQAARLDETEYNEALDRKVRERIKKSLQQLPTDALDLLCRSSVFRRPVPKKFWLAMTGELSLKQQKLAYQALSDRALVEKEGTVIRQHNLIRDIAYNLLREDAPIWKAAERQAAELWLTDYQPVSNAPNLEKVRGYLESLDHLLEVGDWKQANVIAWTQMDTPNREFLCFQLGTWGYYQEQIQLYTKLSKLCREIGDRHGESGALSNLGIAYKNLGNFEQAINCHQRASTISREIGDRSGEAASLNNLGNIYHILGRNQVAIEFQQRCLTIVREIGDRRTEGTALGSLGLAYNELHHHQYALVCHKRHLSIAREIGDRQGEANALGSLGNTYCSLGNVQRALKYHQKRLVITRKIEDRRGEGNALSSLGMCCGMLGDYSDAIDYHQQHLEIAREVGDQQGIGNALGNLGATLAAIKKYSEAIENLQLAAKTFNRISSWASEAQVCAHLAELHQETGETDRALEYCDRALELAIELGIPLMEECEELKAQLENEL